MLDRLTDRVRQLESLEKKLQQSSSDVHVLAETQARDLGDARNKVTELQSTVDT